MALKHLTPYSSRRVCHRADFLRYRKPISQKVTHMPYVDDLKIYAPSEKNPQRMMENVKDGLDLKAMGIFKYRGRRGGKKAKHNVSLERHPKSIQVVESRRPSKTCKQQFEHGKLICIQRENNSTRISPTTEFAVPKCLFTNICSLAKSKNRLRAPVAIEAHLNNQDIDICVVSETHLSTDLPDSIVNIPEYNLFRRDRGWLRRDKRKNGGIAIYVRKNIKVLNIYRSGLYELICMTLLLPSGHRFLVCGFYNPPKHQYREQDLIDYIISSMDNELGKHPDSVLLCGGDVNCLDVHEFQALSWWNIMVDFPTSGNACLDNCFTDRVNLFGSPYPIIC